MKIKLLVIFACCLWVPHLQAADKIEVVASNSTLASIAGAITGDRADIYCVAAPNRDLHFIEPTPKDVMKLKDSDVFIHAGLDLEAWRGPLLNAVGRLNLMWPAGERQIDASRGIFLLEVPETLSRAEGDIHAYGNPHYWTDPENAKIMARNIAERLGELYPEDKEQFLRNAETFNQKIDAKLAIWQKQMAPFQGAPVVVYHNSWPYFIRRFGLRLVGELEPKPGIPPTAKHLDGLVKMMKEKSVKIIITEPYREKRTPERVAKETGARVVTFTQSVGAFPQARDYFSMLDYDIGLLEEALGLPEGETR